MSELKKIIENYLYDYPPAKDLYDQINKLGKIYFIGGVLREIKDYNEIQKIRDIDIVVDTEKKAEFEKICERYKASKNSFKGYKLSCSGLIMDVWRLKETWAYKNNLVDYDDDNKVSQLQKTVFLNIDGIVYDLNEDKWYDEKYQNAMKSKILDVVLKDNPAIPLNIMRAMILKDRYKMLYSETLREVISNYLHNGGSATELMQIQLKRYNREILPYEFVSKEIADCSS